MKDLLKVWIGAAAAALVYLAICGVLEAHESRVEQCSVIRCA
ncbi:hypothetical protein AWB73_00089 [Caballeronia turbans]|jgi:hypothetical protein|nr:hypothetical protein AWB73_00089 [Caballeronia turbans]